MIPPFVTPPWWLGPTIHIEEEAFARSTHDREITKGLPLPPKGARHPGSVVRLSRGPPDGTTHSLDMQEVQGHPETGTWPFTGRERPPGNPQQAQSSHQSHQVHGTCADPRAKQGRRGVDDAGHWGETVGRRTA
jgi:hypothetical protein